MSDVTAAMLGEALVPEHSHEHTVTVEPRWLDGDLTPRLMTEQRTAGDDGYRVVVLELGGVFAWLSSGEAARLEGMLARAREAIA